MAAVASSRREPAVPPEASVTPKIRHRELWLLAGIVIVGAAIRFSTLDQQSFWLDEATTWGIVSHGLGHVLSTVPKTESTPPLYYVLVWLWAQVFGTGEVGLRSFSALCGTLTIPVMWAVGRRLASERIGLVAALVTAVNPLLFWYSQEARTYALLVLLSALSLLAFLRALEQPSRGRLVCLGVDLRADDPRPLLRGVHRRRRGGVAAWCVAPARLADGRRAWRPRLRRSRSSARRWCRS